MDESDISAIKNKLQTYQQSDIIFNEPHFTRMLVVREGSQEEVIKHLLHPNRLIYIYQEKRKDGCVVHYLHFKISNTRTLRLPVIFDKDGQKSIYTLTYIVRLKAWQNLVKI